MLQRTGLLLLLLLPFVSRFGRKDKAFYRIVSTDSRRARNAKPLEYLGTYDPFASKRDGVKEITLKVDRVKYWLSVGAQPSSAVERLLSVAGLAPQPPIKYQPQKSKPRKEIEE